jgi:hypothetical protein
LTQHFVSEIIISTDLVVCPNMNAKSNRKNKNPWMKRLTCGFQFEFVATIDPERDLGGAVREFNPRDQSGRALSDAPFCRFDFPTNLRVSGVYAITLNDRIAYVGETNDLSRRFGEYGDIVVPKPGNPQATNRRVNHGILDAARRGDVVQVWFHETTNRDTVEATLILSLDLLWNRESPRGVAGAANQAPSVSRSGRSSVIREAEAAKAAPPAPDRIAGSRLKMRDLVIRRVGPAVGGKNPHVVCQADGIGRIAFWGRTNIDLLRARAGEEPFGVRCNCRGSNIPDHDAWVPENQRLQFITQTSGREV